MHICTCTFMEEGGGSYENTVNSILDNHASWLWNRSSQKWNLQKENKYLSWNITQYSTLHEWISMKNSVGFNGDMIVTLRENHLVNKDQKYKNHAGRICMLQLYELASVTVYLQSLKMFLLTFVYMFMTIYLNITDFFTFLCILCNRKCMCVKASINKIILINISSSAQCYWKLLNMLIWGPVHS